MALKDQKDVLIAWINGEDIQFKVGDAWHNCSKFAKCDSIDISDGQYRIKPKEIVTTTCIQRDIYFSKTGLHVTYSSTGVKIHNLRLTWSEDGETLLKAEVI
jgi:hypothetical protein